MTNDGTSGEWLEKILAVATDGEDIEQLLRCPECDAREFVIAELASVGMKDHLGLVCVTCGQRLANTVPVEMDPRAQDQLHRPGDEVRPDIKRCDGGEGEGEG